MRAEWSDHGQGGAARTLRLRPAPSRFGPVTLTGCAALAFFTACAPIATLTRPEGSGGWSADRRRAELGQRAQAAGVTFEPPAAAGPAAAPPDATSAPRGPARPGATPAGGSCPT
jgi:hypothetical protein